MHLNPKYRPFESLAGKLLISHPMQRHDAFRHTVVLVTGHGKSGARGTILNRPAHKSLAQLAPGFAPPPLSEVPLYEGGPMQRNVIAFCGWLEDDAGEFGFQFGLSKEVAAAAVERCPWAKMRAFVGNAGWAPGQLEAELRMRAWVVTGTDILLMAETDGDAQWTAFLERSNPVLRVLAEAPEVPANN
ncbi:MAG: YqgE/AlgH family protein [Puniceicoccales bacterium]|jgi:putative transcriptional regulator|nr:YqgE/AlgH family protein [Puniceicoccales bacterium]